MLFIARIELLAYWELGLMTWPCRGDDMGKSTMSFDPNMYDPTFEPLANSTLVDMLTYAVKSALAQVGTSLTTIRATRTVTWVAAASNLSLSASSALCKAPSQLISNDDGFPRRRRTVSSVARLLLHEVGTSGPLTATAIRRRCLSQAGSSSCWSSLRVELRRRAFGCALKSARVVGDSAKGA